MTSFRGRRWLWMLVAAGVLSQTALNLLRPITTYKVVALGGSSEAVGLTTAAYAMLPLLCALWLGRLTDRTPALLRLVRVGALLLTTGGVLLALAPSIALVAFASVALGMGHLFFTISGQAAIARYCADDDLDFGFGWFTASYSVGQTVGPLAGGTLLGSGATGRVHDIDVTLGVGAAVALLALPPLLVPLGARPSRTAAAADPAQAAVSMRRLLVETPGMASNMFASMSLLATMDILVSFLPLVAEHAGVSPVAVGWLLAARGAASVVSRTGLSALVKRFRREHLLIASVTGAGVTLAVAPSVIANVWLCGVLVVVGGYFLGLGQPLTMTLISTAVPAHWRSQALAVRLMGNRLGQVGFPMAAGLVAGPLGSAAAVWITSAALVVSGVQKSLALRRCG